VFETPARHWIDTILTCAALLAAGCRGPSHSEDAIGGFRGVAVLPNSFAVFYSGCELGALAPSGAPIWRLSLPDQATIIADVAIAPSSATYVRGSGALYAVSAEGKLLWRVVLPEPPSSMSRRSLAPVALADSTVVILENHRQLRAFAVDGAERWSAGIPAGDAWGPLRPCPNGQVLVTTTGGIYTFSSKGDVAWSFEPPPGY